MRDGGVLEEKGTPMLDGILDEGVTLTDLRRAFSRIDGVVEIDEESEGPNFVRHGS